MQSKERICCNEYREDIEGSFQREFPNEIKLEDQDEVSESGYHRSGKKDR
jgi:hypothetical protein